MKTSTTVSALLGLLSAPAMTMGDRTTPQQIELAEGDVNFKITYFGDGRTTPYRMYFWEKSLTGSSFRFDEDGDVVYFKAGSKVYRDRKEMKDGSVAFMSKPEMKHKGHSKADDSPMDDKVFANFDCDQCTAALSTVCESGLPAFCDKLDPQCLHRDGYSSVSILCNNFRRACTTWAVDCEDVCTEELEPSMCSNGIKGVESSNGEACCVAECGICGGEGCGTIGAHAGLGGDDCCATEIADDGEACSVTMEAPCFIGEPDVEDDSSSDDEEPSMCSNGIKGVESSNGEACCVAECGICGGEGCGTIGGRAGLGGDDCCATEIVDDGEACSVSKKAPCFIDEFESEDMDVEMDADEDDHEGPIKDKLSAKTPAPAAHVVPEADEVVR